MFLHLDTFEKNVLVLGGSIQAFNAVMSLKQNSDVTLVAHKTDLCSEFQSQIGLGEFGWYNRVYRPLDLKGKDMVINFDPSIKGLSKECKERGITYQNLSKNVSLEFGSTFKFGKLEIGTSTSGAAPLLEQSINDYISSIIPGFLPVAVEKMEKLTARLYEETLSSPTQVDFLNYIAQHWYLNAIARLTDSSISKLIEFYNNGNLTPSSDSVGLVWEKEEDKPAVVSKSVSETSSQSTAADSLEKEQLLRSESFSNRSSRPLVNEIKESPKKIPSVKTSVEIIDGAKAVSTVAYQFSEVSYIYPVYSENYPGENMIEWSKSRKQNVYNSSTKVINTTAHVGAGQSIAGSLSSGSKTSAVLSSAALGYLLPAMYNIVRDKQYPVFHVASNLISDELVLEHSNADIYKAVHTGFSILSSSNAQEAYDMAIVAHLAAEASHKPVLHFFDGVRVASQETSSVVANLRDVKQYSPDKTYGTTFEAISETLANVSKLLNRSYKPFEYHGSANAKVVLISMGSTGSAIKPAVDRLASVGHNVGYVNIRVFRPWSPAAFLSVIPTATEKIIVVDQANTSPVAIDVETAYYGQTNRNAPSVETVSFQKGLENIHPIFVEQYLANYLDGSLSREIIFDEQALSTEFHYKNSTSALFWDKKSTKTSKTIEIITGDFDKKHVQKYSQQMATSVVPAELNHLQFSENAFEEGNIVLQADLIMVNDLGIATGYNFALPLVANGKIFFNTSLSKEDLLESIPADVKKDLAKKSVSIYTLDANLVATNYTIFYGNPTHYLQEVLAAVFYRLSLGEGEFNATLNKQIARINQTAEKINVRETLKESIYYALKHLQNVGVVPSESAVVENATQKFVQGTVPSKSIFNEEDLEHSTEVSSRIVPNHRALLPVIFPTAFKTTQKLRPDIEGAFTVTVTENYRLTPDSYDRNVFHMELDITGTGLKYDIGDALGVYAQNDVEEVHKFLKSYGLNPQQVVYIDRPDGEGNTVTELRSIEQIFIHTLDIFGKPGKKFYQHLAVKATEDSEKEEIAAILETTEGFEKYVEDYTPTFADLLAMFPSAKLSIEELLVQIPSMKPRHYSIASSQKKHPNSVHLLIVVVDWESKDGVKRFGQATRFLVNAAIGSTISVSVKPSVMKLPPSLEAPVIMAGLGTGMAPFRAFIEERMYWKEKGKKVGPMVLYFGSRNRANEYLYGEELEAYHDDGILTHLRLAFSRDQKQKVYIQHKIQEDKDLLHDLIIKQNGSFYLCGPTWPVPDVTNALLESFVTSMSQEDADHMLEDLKHLERFVLEVY
ncbi:hypothetical protein HK103_005406 [Boothiomyces macroporosus]|uniref:assimilatory sulfite reductase (NADPH) n=1 Tax=Boothiomyces macroporosus TaxID=261099 RepID=A0AAD5UM01_9FUNG|nr:hypothetical protein HK103_005406 [Boothiomyces macroporosus]